MEFINKKGKTIPFIKKVLVMIFIIIVSTFYQACEEDSYETFNKEEIKVVRVPLVFMKIKCLKSIDPLLDPIKEKFKSEQVLKSSSRNRFLLKFESLEFDNSKYYNRFNMDETIIVPITDSNINKEKYLIYIKKGGNNLFLIKEIRKSNNSLKSTNQKFSGKILYHTLNGKIIEEKHYKNGILINRDANFLIPRLKSGGIESDEQDIWNAWEDPEFYDGVTIYADRETYSDQSTISSYYVTTSDNYVSYIEGFFLEPAYNPDFSNIEGSGYAIAPGTYSISSYSSTNYPDHYTLDNVPGRSDILIHTGNFPDDTQGCLLPGTSSPVNDQVWHSNEALNDLYNFINEYGQEGVRIIISE